MQQARSMLLAARVTPLEFFHSLLISVGVFILLGTVAALWANPFFVRMTPIVGFEVALLTIQSVLIGLYFGIRRVACATRKAGLGGVLGYLGVACPVCNKVLLLIFAGDVLLTYFEPIRLYVGLAGVFLIIFALWQKLLTERPDAAISQNAPRISA
jgi:hypothetical protein